MQAIKSTHPSTSRLKVAQGFAYGRNAMARRGETQEDDQRQAWATVGRATGRRAPVRGLRGFVSLGIALCRRRPRVHAVARRDSLGQAARSFPRVVATAGSAGAPANLEARLHDRTPGGVAGSCTIRGP
jgi:hypothetical protein